MRFHWVAWLVRTHSILLEVRRHGHALMRSGCPVLEALSHASQVAHLWVSLVMDSLALASSHVDTANKVEIAWFGAERAIVLHWKKRVV